LIRRKATFNSDHNLRVSSRTGLVCSNTPSYANQGLQTTTNSSNIEPVCTILTAAPLFRPRTGQTIMPTNAPRRKQIP
jgi:hypothetical protein